MEDVKVRVNEMTMCLVGDNKVLGSIFGIFLSDLELMSDSAVKSLIGKGISLVVELYEGIKIPKTIKRQFMYGKRVLSSFSREEGVQFIIESFLSSEGLSTLSGFGVSVCEKKENGGNRIKGRLAINPEKMSIYGEV